MESRIKRINIIRSKFADRGIKVSKDSLCRELGVSRMTLSRYVGFLRSCGAEIIGNRNEYIFLRDCGSFNEDSVTKNAFVSIKILIYICNNNPCSRQKAVNFFCKRRDVDDVEKMTERTLDMHLKRLVLQKLVEQSRTGRSISYGIPENRLPLKDLSFSQCMEIMSCLKLSKPLLPLQKTIDSIIDKLSGIMLNYMETLSGKLDETAWMDSFISISPDNDFEQVDERMIRELCGHCQSGSILRILTDKCRTMSIIPVETVYNWKNGCWYLVFRNVGSRRGFELIRVDRLKSFASYISPGIDRLIDRTELEEIRINAEQKINGSFGAGLDRELSVKVIFLNHFNVVEKAKAELSGRSGMSRDLPDGSFYFNGKIEGVMDFLSWLRRFGSSVIIVSPAWMREKHINSAYRVLDSYGEKYDK